MNIVSFEVRAKDFIEKEIGRLSEIGEQADKAVDRLKAILAQYREASNDLIEARKQYIDLISKYETGMPTGVANPFPGVQSSLPSYSPLEMASDTDQMQQIANVVIELQGQIDVLGSQVTGALKAVISNVGQTVTTGDQVSAHMEQFLTGLESPYDAGNLGGVLG